MIKRLPPELACTYCGLATTGVDHVPPKCVRSTLLQLPVDRIPKFVEVSCCRECNSALGHMPLWTVPERKAYIKQWLKRRYGHYLELPHWAEDELDELGPTLRQYVESGGKVAELIRARLRW